MTHQTIKDTDGEEHLVDVGYSRRLRGWHVSLDGAPFRFVPFAPGIFPTATNLIIAAGFDH